MKILQKLDVADLFKSKGLFSFLNLTSISNVEKVNGNESIFYMADGFLMACLLSILYCRRVKRYSFDFSSIADEVFSYCVEKKLSLYVVGASEKEIEGFSTVIRKMYPEINIVGFRNGYFQDGEAETEARKIVELSCDVVLIGMGAGLQEEMLMRLANYGFSGVGFSCGGFIRQTATSSGYYYPEYISMFGMRAFYRMYKEPHTIKRYLFDYPKNIVKLTFKRLFISEIELILKVSDDA